MSHKIFFVILVICITLGMQLSVFAAEPDNSGSCSNGVCTLNDRHNSGDHADNTASE